MHPVFSQIVVAVAAAVELALASQLNPKARSIPWANMACTWQRDADGGFADAVHRSRLFCQHTLAGLEVSKDAYMFHYAGDTNCCVLGQTIGFPFGTQAVVFCCVCYCCICV